MSLITTLLCAKKTPRNDAKPHLEGPRLILRPARPGDWPQWKNVRTKNRHYLEPFEPRWDINCLSKRYFHRRIAQQTKSREDDKAYSFIIFHKQTNDLIGSININNITRGPAQFASLGYWLAQAYQGKGYMGEAAQLIINYAFTTLKLERLNAGCLIHNQKSQNMLRRLGFTEEGRAIKYLQINGIRQDHILFGLNIDDWLQKQEPDAIDS